MEPQDQRPDAAPELSPEELYRRLRDAETLRSLGIAPATDLVSGVVQPWRDHPLFRFPEPEPERSDLDLDAIVVRSPLLPSS